MDRRTLVVGGGVAALAAVATGTAAAAASPARRLTTSEHARRVLGTVNVDLGLADIEGARRRLAEGIAAYQASAPRDPNARDLYAWAERRVADLTGRRDAFGDVMLQIPQTRALLAFALLFTTQHLGRKPLPISQSMPVPTVLARLETDFLPELAGLIEAEGKSRREFAELIDAAAAELDRFVPPVSVAVPLQIVVAISASLIAGIVTYFDTK